VSSEPAPALSALDPGELEGVIAPALELAVVVARVSAQLRPPVQVPRAMRAVVRFARLPASARPAVRKALDGDEPFRARVAVAGDELGLPRASSLFLHRPAGWEGELVALVREAVEAGAASEADRTDRALQRRLAGAEAAAVRLEVTLEARRAESSRAADELANERRSRRDAEEQAAALRRRAEAAERERDGARRRLEELVGELERVRAELDTATSEAIVGAQERRALVEDVSVARSAAAEARTAAAEAELASSQLSRRLAGAFGDAARAAAVLGQAIASAAEVLGGADQGRAATQGLDGPDPGDLPGDADDDARIGPGRAAPGASGAGLAGTPGSAGAGAPAVPTPSRAARAASRSRSGRAPHPLPPAVFDDSREAAEHLVRVPGMLVLVDGYNVTLSAWQDLPISTQRSRLVDASSELVARSGAEVMIVFDGAEEPADLRARGSTSRVRWRFSPVDVEADDVLLDLVADLEPDRPVTVASSDRRVRDGARRLGANAISTPQLLAVLRREPSAGSGGAATGS